MLDRIRNRARDAFETIVALRRQIHRNPELALEETQTAALVAETLRPLGLYVQTGIYETGVVASLDGLKPGPTLLLRADMDALPISEATGLPFASETAGVMHACGHDAHTASLLGTAIVLSELKEHIHGRIRFCFQPSEERIPGGAKFMIEQGVLEGRGMGSAVDTVFGQHVAPDLPTGAIGVRSGAYMASADELHITIHGAGGHAAAPHTLSADATYVAAQVVTALQSIASRHSPPGTPTILSVGKLMAEGATNVIPEHARLEGTFRTMDEDWRFRAHDLIRRVVTHTAEAHGATADVEVRVGYPSLHNDPETSALVKQAAEDYVGAGQTVDLDRWYAGEDFAYFLQERPGTFYRLGTGNEEAQSTHGLHTPQFTVDEEALRVGAGFMAYLAWRYGNEHSS
ncbi:M20 metallopeptidase family protein [Salisaeta longa]|uniref:M20 metallopeptidase family protein n=1 Tax=Salisaeta longa TaxID=503170 RepID=UPI00048EBF10|nr:M20 family metallopeptidase [Salisaeta longa]